MLFTDFILGHLQVTYISLSGFVCHPLPWFYILTFSVSSVFKNKYAYLNQICCLASLGGGIMNSKFPYTPNQQTNTHSGGCIYLGYALQKNI